MIQSWFKGYRFGKKSQLVLAKKNFSKAAQLQKNVACFSIGIIVQKVEKMVFVFVSHDLNRFCDSGKVHDTFFLRSFFRRNDKQCTPFMERVFMAVQINGSVGLGLGLPKTSNGLAPVVGAALNSITEQIGKGLMGNGEFDFYVAELRCFSHGSKYIQFIKKVNKKV